MWRSEEYHNRHPWAVILLAMTIGGLVTASAVVRTQETRVRRIHWDSEVPLVDRLLPDDETVVVVRSLHGIVGFPRPTTASQAATDVMSFADLALLMRVTHVEGALTADGAWVRTRFRGSVERVIRRQRGIALPGPYIEAERPGGTVQIGRVTVRALENGREAPVLPIGETYLVFLKASDGTWGAANTPLLVRDGLLMSPPGYAPADEALEWRLMVGATLSTVIRALR